MGGLRSFLVILLVPGVVSCGHDWSSAPALEVTVRPRDNITLYCDCKLTTGELIVWYRNCSHENQPSLVLKLNHETWRQSTFTADVLNPLPRFHFVRNYSSDSYDLLIMNITNSDEGLYYCGTEQRLGENKEQITSRSVHRYGIMATRIIFNSSEPYCPIITADCGVCWMLLFSLCPAFAVLPSVLSSLLVYLYCQKTATGPKVDMKRCDTRGQTRVNKDEDVCYVAVEIHETSQMPKKKKAQSSDFTTYSAVNTCRI